MCFSNVIFDNTKTKERCLQLKNLYESCYPSNKCMYFDSCSTSIKAKSTKYWEINDWSARVGRNYDITIGGKPVRILIIGKEALSSSKKLYEPSGWWPEINRHYSVTYQTLKNMFSYYAEDNDNPILTMFAMTNTYSCAFKKHDGQTTGIPNTEIQKNNCSLIRRKELEILNPTIILIQYDGLKAYNLFDDSEYCKDKVYYSNKAKCFAIESSHPSTRRHPWKNDLNKSIEYLKEIGALPKVTITE